MRWLGHQLRKRPAPIGSARTDILATAAELLRTRGYALTTTYEIAERADAADAIQCRCFPSKDDIVAALVAISGAIISRAATPEARLWALC